MCHLCASNFLCPEAPLRTKKCETEAELRGTFRHKLTKIMTRIDSFGGKQHSTQHAVEGKSTQFLEQNFLKIILLTALAAMVWNGQISLSLSFGDLGSSPKTDISASEHRGKATKAAIFSEIKNFDEPEKRRNSVRMPDGQATSLTCSIDPDFAERNALSSRLVEQKARICNEYVQKYAPIAVAEMRKFGIPASITLAQGLLESDAGQSKLARSTNNHFGMKCFSRKCGKGHCQNFTDDTHKDFFLNFGSAWGSFRAHSEFLKNSDRYKNLFKINKNDPESWAKGLKSAGYATDKKYAEKLLAIIDAFDLTRFD
jgi:flagellum-specific peptidoglycan hydrolase FlgJ